MKLGKLNAAIDAAPEVLGVTRLGPIPFKKGAFKAALTAHYSGDRTAETGLRLNELGHIVRDDVAHAGQLF